METSSWVPFHAGSSFLHLEAAYLLSPLLPPSPPPPGSPPFSPSVPWLSPVSALNFFLGSEASELLCHLLSCLASCHFSSGATDLDVNLVLAIFLRSSTTLNGGRPSWWARCSVDASPQAPFSSIQVLPVFLGPSVGTELLWGQQHGPVLLLSLLLSLR